MNKPTPLDIEIELDPKRYIVSETDEKGKITFCNDYFIEVSGYSKEETISAGKNINALVKNLSKDGRYYWIFTEFEIRKDTDTGKIIGYHAARKSISKHVIEVIADLYAKLLQIEKDDSIEDAETYLVNFLKEKGDDIEFANIMEEIHKFY